MSIVYIPVFSHGQSVSFLLGLRLDPYLARVSLQYGCQAANNMETLSISSMMDMKKLRIASVQGPGPLFLLGMVPMIQGFAGLRCHLHRPIRGPHATTRASSSDSCFALFLSNVV